MKCFEFGQWNDTLRVLLHGGLIAGRTEQFIEDVKAVHAASQEERNT